MKARTLSLIVTLPIICVTYTHAQTTHTFTAAGSTSSAGSPVVVANNWGDAANWDGSGVPNSSTTTALFSPATGGYSVRFVAADGTTPFVSDVNILRYSGTPGAATTFHNIGGAGGINLTGTNPTIDNQSAAQSVFYYANITGSGGFNKTGAGRFTMRFNGIDQSYSGLVKISGGTLGIEKDRSLGAVDNDIEIAGGARLFAEPGANAGTIILPTTRSITLSGGSGGAQQIGSNPAQVNLVVEGNITEADPSGITKTDAGILTLAGTNAWTGTTTVNAGVLSLVKPEALPGYDPLGPSFGQTYNVANGATLAVRYGDASTWTVDQINALVGTSSFNTTGSFGFDTTGNATDTTYSDDIAGAGASGITKLGAGKITLSGSPGLTRITMYDGTLELGAASSPAADVAVLFLKTGATLNLGNSTASASALTHFNGGTSTIANGTLTLPATYSFAPTAANTTLALPSTIATFGRVQPFGGGTTTISGAGGSLTVNGDFNFDVNSTQNTRLLMGGLSAFTYNRSNRAFRCLPATAATNTTVHELVLAGGTNTVTANLVQVGGASGTSQGSAHQGQMRLGAINDFRTPTFQVGAFNGSGVVNYQAGITAPSFKLRGADGASPATTLLVGDTSSGVRSGAGTLDLSAGTVDISAASIMIGRHIANSNDPATTSAITVQDGAVTATTLTLVRKQGGGSPATTGNFNHNGGQVTVEDLVMVETADNVAPNVASATQNLQANYNLDGGTLAAVRIKQGILATPITAGNTQRNLVLRGGTLINKSGADLTISGVTMLAAGNTTTVVDSTAGQKVVLAADATYSARLNSAAETCGTLTVDGDLDITASPLFTIFDDAATNASLLPGGTKLVLIDYQDGSLTGTFNGLPDGTTVSVTKGTVTNDFVLDYNDPAYGGKAVTLTVPAGSGFGTWITGTFANGTVPSGQQGPQDDPDGDGIENLIEYAVAGLDPTQSNGVAGSQTGLTVTYLKRQPVATDIAYSIESSDDLGVSDPWAPAAGVSQDDTQISVTLTNPGDNFARLKVTEN